MMEVRQDEKDGKTLYVGDTFWLRRAADLVSDTQKALTRQAERLSLAIAWFWTAYLAFVGLDQQKSDPLDIFDVAPFAMLILAYVAAIVAQGPARGSFDPRSPDDILQAHNRSTAFRLNVLRGAYLLLFLSGLNIAVAVLRT